MCLDLREENLRAFILRTDALEVQYTSGAIINNLMKNGEYTTLIDILSNTILFPQSNLSQLICMAVLSTATPVSAWRQLQLLRNPVLAATLTLEYMKHWEVGFSLFPLLSLFFFVFFFFFFFIIFF